MSHFSLLRKETLRYFSMGCTYVTLFYIKALLYAFGDTVEVMLVTLYIIFFPSRRAGGGGEEKKGNIPFSSVVQKSRMYFLLFQLVCFPGICFRGLLDATEQSAVFSKQCN